MRARSRATRAMMPLPWFQAVWARTVRTGTAYGSGRHPAIWMSRSSSRAGVAGSACPRGLSHHGSGRCSRRPASATGVHLLGGQETRRQPAGQRVPQRRRAPGVQRDGGQRHRRVGEPGQVGTVPQQPSPDGGAALHGDLTIGKEQPAALTADRVRARPAAHRPSSTDREATGADPVTTANSNDGAASGPGTWVHTCRSGLSRDCHRPSTTTSRARTRTPTSVSAPLSASTATVPSSAGVP